MATNEDSAVEEVRELRRRVSEECGHDMALLVERCVRLQAQYQDRLVRAEAATARVGQDAA